ncbi:DNA cytosine methyltransferase [Streptomyces celluloflavus]|uniref:DNA cytosine methyltransferase n=1 Tax=Streptomyces celluloflavus TaxID=58344 RepID=UPI0036B926BB
MSGLRIGSLCTGYGGLDMAVQQTFGGSLAWLADNDPGAARILAHHHPQVPNLGDLTAVDWRSVEPVDVLTAGYPCQPFSSAGRRKGTTDDRHIWPHIARALRALRPRVAVFENVANHLRLGFDVVLGDLAGLGFDASWCVVRASDVGAPHQRRRLFVVATATDTPNHGHQRPRAPRDGRGGPEDSGVAAADTNRGGQPGYEESPGGQGGVRQRVRHDADRRQPTPADAARVGRGEGRPEPARQQGGPGPARGGTPDWGVYGPAVARWEAVTGRPAPGPTDTLGRLSPPFVEWMQGLDAGHVTDVPDLTRAAQLKALGNGVVPRQAAHALGLLTTAAQSTERRQGWAA